MALELPDLDKHPSPHIKALKKNVVSLYDVVEIALPLDQAESVQAAMREATQRLLDGGDFDSWDQVIHAIGKQVNAVMNQNHIRRQQSLNRDI